METHEHAHIDPADAVALELESLKNTPRIFKSVRTKCKNYIFINSEKDNQNELVDAIFEDNLQNETKKTRFCLKLYPIITSSHIDIDSIKKKFLEHVVPLINAKEFKNKTYDFLVKVINSQSDKKQIMNEIEDLLCENCPQFIRTYKNPTSIIGFFVMRNVCLMSILNDYERFKKYNLDSFIKR